MHLIGYCVGLSTFKVLAKGIFVGRIYTKRVRFTRRVLVNSKDFFQAISEKQPYEKKKKITATTAALFGVIDKPLSTQ